MAVADLFWWIGAGVLIVMELMSGTFYLLMIAFGCAAAGLLRLAGADFPVQCVAAALVALGAMIALRRSRFNRRRPADAQRNRDVNLDIGASLTITEWHDRRARTTYRGTQWDVELAPGEPEDARFYEVTALRGSCLVVAASKPVTKT